MIRLEHKVVKGDFELDVDVVGRLLARVDGRRRIPPAVHIGVEVPDSAGVVAADAGRDVVVAVAAQVAVDAVVVVVEIDAARAIQPVGTAERVAVGVVGDVARRLGARLDGAAGIAVVVVVIVGAVAVLIGVLNLLWVHLRRVLRVVAPASIGGYAVFALLAISWDILAQAGMISLGQALFFGVGAYLSGVMNHSFGWHPLVTMPLAALFGGLICTLCLLPVLRHRR